MFINMNSGLFDYQQKQILSIFFRILQLSTCLASSYDSDLGPFFRILQRCTRLPFSYDSDLGPFCSRHLRGLPSSDFFFFFAFSLVKSQRQLTVYTYRQPRKILTSLDWAIKQQYPCRSYITTRIPKQRTKAHTYTLRFPRHFPFNFLVGKLRYLNSNFAQIWSPWFKWHYTRIGPDTCNGVDRNHYLKINI